MNDREWYRFLYTEFYPRLIQHCKDPEWLKGFAEWTSVFNTGCDILPQGGGMSEKLKPCTEHSQKGGRGMKEGAIIRIMKDQEAIILEIVNPDQCIDRLSAVFRMILTTEEAEEMVGKIKETIELSKARKEGGDV